MHRPGPELRRAYDETQAGGGAPLHIVRGEAAALLPDIVPPRGDMLERALKLRTVGERVVSIAPRAFPASDGDGAVTLEAFLRPIPKLSEDQTVSIEATPERAPVRLAYDKALFEEIEKALDGKVGAMPETARVELAAALEGHLAHTKRVLAAEHLGADPLTLPPYTRERDRVLNFIQDLGVTT